MTHFYRGPVQSSDAHGVASLPRISSGVLSPFGRELRRLRFEAGKRIFDLAQDLEVSSSSVSAWETGRRDVGEEEIKKIGDIFNLDDNAIAKLRQAAELSKNRVLIEPQSDEAKQLANLIKKRINELSSDTIEAIMKHLKWIPNGRIRWDMRVARKSVEEIEKLAQRVRRIEGSESSDAFDIVKFYDTKLDQIFFHFMKESNSENTCFEIWQDSEMPKDTRGMATMFPPHIVISNSVYEDAAKGGHGGRWIMAHELGHLFLLHGIDGEPQEGFNPRGPEYYDSAAEQGVARDFPLPFAPPPNLKRIPRNQSAETQADDFAAELLMPRQFCLSMLPHNIGLRYNVSVSTAKKRLKIICRSKTTYH